MMFFTPLTTQFRHIFYDGEKILRYDRPNMTFIFREPFSKLSLTIKTKTIFYGRTFQTCSGDERALLFGRRQSTVAWDGPSISAVRGIS